MLEFEKELKTRRLREIDQIEKSVEVDLYNNQQKRLEELEEFENKIHSLSIIEKAYELGQVDKDVLNKARSGVYKDTPYNRKHGRVGVRFGKKVEGGDTKGLDDDGKEKEKEADKKIFEVASKVYDKVDYKDLNNKNKIKSALKSLGKPTDPLYVGTIIRRIKKEIGE
jgi:hypothetical protein